MQSCVYLHWVLVCCTQMACTKHGVTKVGQEAYIVQLLTTLHVLLGVVKDFTATCVDSIVNVSIF